MNYTNILKARQIKAARALLDWSQDDLATAANLSVATIRKLELGQISPRSITTGQIRNAFENAGLEFLEPDGVRHRPEDITVYQGAEQTQTFFDEVYHTGLKKGDEIVVVCAEEKPFSEALGSYQSIHLKRMETISNQVKVKCIITEDVSHLPAVYCEYRFMSKHYVDSVPFYIYGDNYAIFDFNADPCPKITVIRSASVASAFRCQFRSMWEKATPLNRSQVINKSGKKRN